MARAAGHILKGNDVKLEGQFHLDVGMVQPPMGSQKISSQVLSVPKARVVESYPEYAVIEVTCSCGVKTNLKCEFVGSNSSLETKTQNNQIAVSG